MVWLRLKKLERLNGGQKPNATKQDKAARQASINEDKDSVRSVIDDVDALLKSADPLPLSDSSSAKHDSSHDVMKELDELINS